MKTDAVVGGDPTITRACLLEPKFAALYYSTEAVHSMEVPCQNCGRGVLLSPSSQRVALGEGEPVVALSNAALSENRIEAEGLAEPSEGTPAVLCMFCAFADHPDLIEPLEKALADAKRTLGE